MKRGQAALEFLTTYGWALLVILVMIGALVYFGLLNPSRALPARCDAPPGFQCKDFQFTENSVKVIVGNKNGEALQALRFSDASAASSDADGRGTDDSLDNVTCTISPTVVPADENFNITCTPAAGNFFSGLSGEKIKAEFTLTYLPARATYEKTAQFTVFAPVQ